MKWDTDRTVSVAAMLVGLGSLFIVVYQTELIREQQKASVLPYLMIAYNSDEKGAYIALRNVGLGPAKIEHVRVRQADHVVDGDPFQYYAALKRTTVPAEKLYRDRVLPGELIPAGQVLNMLGSANGAMISSELLRTFRLVAMDDALPEDGATPADKAVLEIDYASVYGERWRVRSDQVVPTPL